MAQPRRFNSREIEAAQGFVNGNDTNTISASTGIPIADLLELINKDKDFKALVERKASKSVAATAAKKGGCKTCGGRRR